MDAKKPLVRISQHARYLPADTETPISVFISRVGNGDGILLESAEVDGRWGRYSLLACDMAMQIICKAGKLDLEIIDERLKPLAQFAGQPFIDGLRGLMNALEITADEKIADLPPITRALYGWFGFGMASLFNPVLADIMPAEEARCQLALPNTVLVFDHLYNRLIELSLGGRERPKSAPAAARADLSGKPEIRCEPGEDGYRKNVVAIREMLRKGEAIQVVPSCRFSMPYNGDAFTLYRRLRRFNASPYMFFMRFPGLTLFGSSPEVMVRCTENRLALAPIAGTRRRGRDEAEDKALAEELLADPKEQAEHVMLVDLGRNDLGRVAKAGSVRVDRYMEVERFSHVMHLTSSVSANLDDGRDALDVLAAAFPAGTVSGAPKIRAMRIIRELEGAPRGPYAGCIGWLGLDKDRVNLDLGITIRSMWVENGRLYWQAGGGIVHDSEPDPEWKEVCNKSAIMRLALQAEGDDYVPADR